MCGFYQSVCFRACMRACVRGRACVCACVRVCAYICIYVCGVGVRICMRARAHKHLE